MAQKKKNKRRRRQFQQKVILSVLLVLHIQNWSGGPILIMFILRLRRKSCKRAGNVLCFERIKKNGGICLWHKKRKTKDEDASFSRK